VKILFISRASLFSNRGGDTIQIEQTARWLKKQDVEVDIRLCNEAIDYQSYDLLHFFNIIRPSDILYHIRASSKPYVVSTIFVDYREFDRSQRKGISGFVFRFLPGGIIEYLKVIARALFNGEKIISREYLWMGHRKSIKKIISGSAMLLPNSHNEYRRLSQYFKVEHDYMVVPNAVDPEIFPLTEARTKNPLMVLCVGRFEGLKNQLRLIRALKETEFQLYLVGAASTNQKEYYEECRREAGPNVHFVNQLPQAGLMAYYQEAKVHVLASWFETTGLSSLEAAAMGCNLVITDRGDTREYFEDLAWYCDPGSAESIRKAVEMAAATPVNLALQKKVREQYNWAEAAKKTGEAYRLVLSNKK
jgi:glycosyltransferase involved in cell wall biosynthesis